MIDEPHCKTITELAATYGMSLRTLRFYEERGLLQPYRVGQSRLYSPAEETRLQVIIKAKRMGFSIAEIALLLAESEKQHGRKGPPTLPLSPAVVEQKISLLTNRKCQVDQAIDELKQVVAAV